MELFEDWLTARVRATPAATALMFGEHEWSYRELDHVVNVYGKGLRESGVVTGDHVALLLPNGLAYVALIHALTRLGAVLIPLNARLTAPEIQWQLLQSDAQYVVYDAAFADVITQIGAVDGCKFTDVNMIKQMGAQATSTLAHLRFSLESPQAIVFTSGTTGRPKGAVLTFANHFWGATASSYRLGLTPRDRWLSCPAALPCGWIGRGLSFLPLWHDNCITRAL